MIPGIDPRIGPAIRFEIPGPPRGKGRPRFTSRGGFGRAYTDKATKEYEELIQLCLRGAYHIDQLTDKWPLDGPMRLEVWAHMPIPKGTSKKKTEAMDRNIIKPTKKPDIDNIIKVVMDALNGVVYADDKQVVALVAGKQYSKKPRLCIALYGLTIAGTEVQG